MSGSGRSRNARFNLRHSDITALVSGTGAYRRYIWARGCGPALLRNWAGAFGNWGGNLRLRATGHSENTAGGVAQTRRSTAIWWRPPVRRVPKLRWRKYPYYPQRYYRGTTQTLCDWKYRYFIVPFLFYFYFFYLCLFFKHLQPLVPILGGILVENNRSKSPQRLAARGAVGLWGELLL